MRVILGERDYEKTATGKYPKYNLEQMNQYVMPDCWSYTGIQAVFNIACFDLFGKYQDEISDDEKVILDEEIKKHYGFHSVDISDLIDEEKFSYIEESDSRMGHYVATQPTVRSGVPAGEIK